MKTRGMQWAYLLLGLGLGEGHPRQSHTPTSRGWALGWPSLRAQVIPFYFDNRRGNMIQLALNFHDGRADDEAAARIAEAVWALHTLLGAYVLTDFGVVAYRVPGALLGTGSCPSISEGAVVQWDNSRPFAERWSWERDGRLTLRVAVAPSKSWTALHAVPRALQSPAFEALHLYQESVRKFTFLGDDLTQVMRSDEFPARQADRAAVESAFVESFKAIEAMVGEPGDEQRLRRRLVNMGIDPDEPVGYTEDLSIVRRIRDVHRTRDKRAGHGYRPQGVAPITYRELMNAQALARACILMHLDHLGAFAQGNELERRSNDEWERWERRKALKTPVRGGRGARLARTAVSLAART